MTYPSKFDGNMTENKCSAQAAATMSLASFTLRALRGRSRFSDVLKLLDCGGARHEAEGNICTAYGNTVAVVCHGGIPPARAKLLWTESIKKYSTSYGWDKNMSLGLK